MGFFCFIHSTRKHLFYSDKLDLSTAYYQVKRPKAVIHQHYTHIM